MTWGTFQFNNYMHWSDFPKIIYSLKNGPYHNIKAHFKNTMIEIDSCYLKD